MGRRVYLVALLPVLLLLSTRVQGDYFAKVRTRTPTLPARCFNVSTPSRVAVLFGDLLHTRPAHFAPLVEGDIIRFWDWPADGGSRASDAAAAAPPPTASGNAYLRKPSPQIISVNVAIEVAKGAPPVAPSPTCSSRP